MTNRERVLAALCGAPVDRVPLAFWLHDFAAENDVASFVAESLRLATTFGWDYLKPQSRAQCFAEAWGLRYAASGARAVPYTRTHAPCASAADLRRLQPADPSAGALGEQLEALRRIRAGVGPDTPIIWTVFSPIMVMPYLLAGGVVQALAIAREDLGVLDPVAAAPFNMLHVCGASAHLAEFTDYPVHAFSWAASESNPSLRELHRTSGRAVVGGLPAKPLIARLAPPDIAARARAAIREMEGRGLLLG